MNRKEDLSEDTLCNGRLICRQYRNGYRFSVDSVLAAAFCRPKKNARIVDLGCGCGVIGLLLAARRPDCTIEGVEIQPELAALARENIRANGFADRFTVHETDVGDIGGSIQAESCDLVVCNPPYRQLGSGRINPLSQAAVARHEIKASLADMVRGCAWCVKNRGRVVLVYPAVRFAALAFLLADNKLALKRMRSVYSYPGEQAARLVLVEALKNGGEECVILPPLYIYTRKNGPCSDEVQKMYEQPFLPVD